MEKLKVQLTKEQLFDFLLYHTFSKASGFLVNMLGMCVIVLGAVMQFVHWKDPVWAVCPLCDRRCRGTGLYAAAVKAQGKETDGGQSGVQRPQGIHLFR